MSQVDVHHTDISKTVGNMESKPSPVVEGITSTPSIGESANGKDSPAPPPKQSGISGFFHWHEPGTSREEKRLIFKLDWFLLSFSCLTFFVKQVRRLPSMSYRGGMLLMIYKVGSKQHFKCLCLGHVRRTRVWSWQRALVDEHLLQHCPHYRIRLLTAQTCFPDTPHTTQAFWLTEWEKERARQRIEEEGRKPVGKMNWSVIQRVFGSWQVYAFTAGYAFWTLTCGSYAIQYFTLYLKSRGWYTVPEINNIPTSIGAVNFVFMISTGYIADKIGNRGPVCFGVGSLLTFCYAILTAWSVPHELRMAAFIMLGCYGCYTPLLAGWANEACGGDQQKRAFILGFMVSVGQAVVIPFQQLQLPSGQAPEFKQTHGWPSALAWVVALTLWTGIGIPFLQKWRDGKTKVVSSEDVLEE
ncbi:putative major facilitator superfamily transporter [Ilyonectria robusta]